MPWASFQYSLRKHGVAPEGLKLLHGLSLENAVAAFRQGQADFIHLPEPAIEQLISDGVGHLAVSLGPENGHIAYSSFAATNQFIEENPEVVQPFIQGYSRALQWLAYSDTTEIGKTIMSFFPNVPPDLVAQAVARYKSQDTWPTDPVLSKPEYEGLQEILLSAGLVKERQPYEKVVRRDFAP